MTRHSWEGRRCQGCGLVKTGNGYQRMEGGMIVVRRTAESCPVGRPGFCRGCDGSGNIFQPPGTWEVCPVCNSSSANGAGVKP